MKSPVFSLLIYLYSSAMFFTCYNFASAKDLDTSSKIEKINSHSVQVYNKRGTTKYKSKDYQGALDDFNKGIGIKSESFLHYNRANAKRMLGDKKGAITDYEKAIKINNYNIEAYRNLAATKSELKDDEGAIDDYTKIIRLKPDYAHAYYGRGISKSDLKDHQGAIDDYTKAIELKINFFEVYYNRGLSKSDLKDYQGAIKDYTKAIKLNSTHANTYFNRGMILSKLGEKQAAISDLENALRINPKHANARRNLDLIQSDIGYQLSSLLSTHSLPLIIVAVFMTSMGIWRYRKSSMKVDNVAPKIVNIVKPATIIKGQAAQFGGVATDLGLLDILTYSWNFGDNTQTVIGRDPVHIFSNNGYYDVVLTVTDKDGSITTKTVRVKVNNSI